MEERALWIKKQNANLVIAVVNFSILTREYKNRQLVDNIFSSNFVLFFLFVLLLMC